MAHAMTNAHSGMSVIRDLIRWLEAKKFTIIAPSPSLFPEILASNAISSINRSDIIIADVTNYSHGVGFEIGYAFSRNKSIIVVAESCSRRDVSKFMRGLFPDIVFYSGSAFLITEVEKRIGMCDPKNDQIAFLDRPTRCAHTRKSNTLHEH